MSRFIRLTLAKYHRFNNYVHNRHFYIKSSDNAQFETMAQVKEKLRMFVGQGKIFKPGKTEHVVNVHLADKLAKSQSELPVRTMKDSYDIAIVPIASDELLRDKYITNRGLIRYGRLLEDLDFFAGYCSFKHCLFPSIPENTVPPVVIVTIAVSQIEFKEQVQANTDIQISGHVCWVGTSSVEVIVYLHQEMNGKLVEITRALFLMAARNTVTAGPAIVNAIKAVTPEEDELLKKGEERKVTRKKIMQESLLSTVPTEEELHVVHSLFIKTIDSNSPLLDRRILPPNSKWMQDATRSTLIFCHPEHRNFHNKIFGGFLMRQALELSWIVGFLHGLTVPKVHRISDIGFRNPVDVGSIVKMTGSVTYTEGNYVQIFVIAKAINDNDPKGTASTVFNFTYDMGRPVDRVFPETYLEAMKYLNGRRQFKNVISIPGMEK